MVEEQLLEELERHEEGVGFILDPQELARVARLHILSMAGDRHCMYEKHRNLLVGVEDLKCRIKEKNDIILSLNGVDR